LENIAIIYYIVSYLLWIGLSNVIKSLKIIKNLIANGGIGGYLSDTEVDGEGNPIV